MALIECKDCKHKISKKAKTCPNCGAKNRQTNWLGASIIIVIFLIVVGNMTKNSSSVSSSASTPKSFSSNVYMPKWSYDTTPDKMGRGTIKIASIVSTNEIQFSFPYGGAQRGILQIRNHPKYGKDVIFSIEKGQFLCGLDGCKVSIRFDEGTAQNYSASEAEDHSTDVIFIRGYDRFTKQLKKASKLYIEASFYQEGTRVFEFNVAGFSW